MSVAPVDLPLSQARPARARLFAALAELKAPATTADLAARLGLHVNGVRRHLERLHDEGLVERGACQRSPRSPALPVVGAP